MREETEYRAARDFLELLPAARKRVDVLEERIACIRMMMTDRAVHMNQVRVCCSADPQKNERLIAQIDELEREKAAAEKERDRIYREAQVAIGLIREPKAQEILIRHYLDGLNWSETAREVKYSRRQMIRYREMGYAEIEERWHTDAQVRTSMPY